MTDKELQVTDPIVKKKSRFGWGSFGILLSGLAASIFVAAIILANYATLTINRQLSDAVVALNNAVTTSNIALNNLEAAVQQQSRQAKKDDYLAAEAYYLVKLANDSLQYENNPLVAIRLLQSADQTMTKLGNDPNVYAVRKTLAADLATLQSVSAVDVTGVYVRLAAINDQISKLPLLTQLAGNHAAQTATALQDEKLPWWHRGFQSLQQALRQIVIVRKTSPDVPPFITPEEQMFLYQNLYAEIEKAQWALLHRQQEIYRLSLQQAMSWIKQYTQQDAGVTQQVLMNLEQLQQINVQPTMPTVMESLQALQAYLGR